MSLALRCHDFFRDCLCQLPNRVVAAGWSTQHLANDNGRLNHVFLGYLQLSFAVFDYAVGHEGKFYHSSAI